MSTTETITDAVEADVPEVTIAATSSPAQSARTAHRAPARPEATAKFVRVSARKARLVADLIRGQAVPNAQAILAFCTRDAAVPVRKVLESAMANADHNVGLTVRDLVIVRATVDEGPTMARMRPRAQGRSSRINKRTCHITIGLGVPDATASGRRA